MFNFNSFRNNTSVVYRLNTQLTTARILTLMKLVFSVLLGLTGTIALASGAIAQNGNIATADIAQPSQSELLITQPQAIQEGSITNPAPMHDSAKLQGVATSIQSGVSTSATPSFTDWIYTTPNRDSDTNPIGFFQVPGPNRSVGLNIKN
jgi:hypothetical protein